MSGEMRESFHVFTRTYSGLAKCGHIKTECAVAAEGKAPKIKNLCAIWDTGCRVTTISRELAEKLALKSEKSVSVNTVGGVAKNGQHQISLLLPANLFFQNLTVHSGSLSGCDVLVGLDIISKGSFSISNTQDETIFSFQIPTEEIIDFQYGLPTIQTIDYNDPINKKPHWWQRIFKRN